MPGSPVVEQRPEVLRSVKGLILDVDGVLFEGQNILPGAFELISYLRQSGIPYVYLSNNTTFPLEHHIKKLSLLGAPVSPASIITAAGVTAQVLVREAGQGARCFVIGEKGLVEALSEAGLKVSQTDNEGAQYVVIGMDRWLTYEKLKGAALAIRRGACFISSNPDPTYPDGINLLPASGAIQAALEATTGVRARITGKPAVAGFETALDRLGLASHEVAMLGDQLAIDVQGAKDAGIKAFLVLSSLTPEYQPAEGLPSPDAVYASAIDFYQHWIQR